MFFFLILITIGFHRYSKRTYLENLHLFWVNYTLYGAMQTLSNLYIQEYEARTTPSTMLLPDANFYFFLYIQLQRPYLVKYYMFDTKYFCLTKSLKVLSGIALHCIALLNEPERSSYLNLSVKALWIRGIARLRSM